jgi:hypothetical protein
MSLIITNEEAGMRQDKLPLTPAQKQAVDAALESLTFLKLVARVQGVGIAKLSRRDLESFVQAADRSHST